MVRSFDSSDLDYRDPAIPGNTFINALWQRDLMRLSDRGRASELVGDRWADLCAESLNRSVGAERELPGSPDSDAYTVSRIYRLDEVPAIAAAASRNKLQNPDFLLFGHRGETSVVQPADAKFSVETVKSKQVSAEVAASLLGLGPIITDHVPDLSRDADLVDGFFLCPDFSLTHYMMQRRGGPRGEVGVAREQIELLPITPDAFMSAIDGRDLALWLARKDDLPISCDESLLAFLYYFRLARACVACWLDQTAPLLSYRDTPVVDHAAVMEVASSVVRKVGTAWDVVLAWDENAEQVRQQRLAIDRATLLPMTSGELRSKIETLAKSAGIIAPSINKVRRLIGSWFRLQIRDEFGSIPPPVEDLPTLLAELNSYSRHLLPQLLVEIERAVLSPVVTAKPENIVVVT